MQGWVPARRARGHPLSDADGITAKYQIISSFLAARALSLVDSSIVANGNVITGHHLPEPLLVAPACSGLRLSIALVMCTWFLVYALEGGWRRKAVLAVLALPIGTLVNAVRIAVIGWAAVRAESSVAVASSHPAGAFVGIATCAALLLGAAWLMGMRNFREMSPADRVEHPNAVRTRVASGPILALLAVLALTATVSGRTADLYNNLPNGHIDKRTIPMSLGEWQGRELPIEADVRRMLAKADMLSLEYCRRMSAGEKVYVLVSHTVDLSMFHDPLLCLSGTGSTISKSELTRIAVPGNGQAQARLLRTREPDGSSSLILYLYTIDSVFLPTKDALNAYALSLKLTDLKQIAQHPTQVSQLEASIRSRETTWYRFVTTCTNPEHDSAALRDFAARFVSRSLRPQIGRPAQSDGRSISVPPREEQ